ncbi:MAG: hypothetical protein PHS16_00665 [Candidatus Colwellbacteria bacterium]|jgi:hypothetical protein|nr:hypothetical protein [Candidatus Colwellbacteria bacterium]MCK9497514.1 hypothetical protein [Candidatus Colwellbacteria bacterium]MDD3752442.1 hypothetical protein [Candidatus Colwellbacteria bacterium]MDD4818688.1 hypothetical protein [Candidatus Colwellbacteria bacterium]
MNNEERIREECRELTRKILGGPRLEVGQAVTHPSGRKVKITRGNDCCNGRVSNFFYWREILSDGELGPEECGYGW